MLISITFLLSAKRSGDQNCVTGLLLYVYFPAGQKIVASLAQQTMWQENLESDQASQSRLLGQGLLLFLEQCCCPLMLLTIGRCHKLPCLLSAYMRIDSNVLVLMNATSMCLTALTILK